MEWVQRLPTIHAGFKPAARDIVTLDDYSAHLTPEVEKALLEKGYFLIHIGGGITGDVQTNDTDYHRPIKREYRERETKLMVRMLKANPDKIPSPSRNQMMQLFYESWNSVHERVDNVNVFKQNMITLALDGSEDHLASRKLMDLVGTEMIEFLKNC